MKDYDERHDNPDKYPWFAYFRYGWHTMTYLTDEEVKQAIRFYHLYKNGCKWERGGRQPITIMPR